MPSYLLILLFCAKNKSFSYSMEWLHGKEPLINLCWTCTVSKKFCFKTLKVCHYSLPQYNLAHVLQNTSGQSLYTRPFFKTMRTFPNSGKKQVAWCSWYASSAWVKSRTVYSYVFKRFITSDRTSHFSFPLEAY